MLQSVTPMLDGITQRFAINAVVIDPNFGFAAANAALESIGVTTSFAMITLLIAFIWNILLVLFRKQTKIRTLFTTGHIMVKQAAVATWIVYFLLPDFRNMLGIIATGILIGTYWAVFSNLTVEATQNLTDNAGFAVGHQQMLGIWVADKFSSKFGKKEDSVDNIKLTGALKIFDDYVVSTTVIMMIFFGIILIVVGEPIMRELDAANFPNGLLFPLYILEKCASFAVNLVILKTGVRMFVGEMVESFQGISGSILKGSLPAVDCAATYGFGSTNAVTLSFLFGAIGQIIAITGLLIFKSPLMIIPGFVPLFYDNATIGLYANNRGGIKALIAMCLGSAFAIMLFGMSTFGGYVGNFDWATLWPTMGVVIKYLAIPGVIICTLGMLVIPQLQYRNNKKEYFDLAEGEE
ncbi:MAG: PTS ascorbate transporter subunit IIC [Anaerorhabdus sp.]|uniref:PTS ascorbate transporter subunit IIC n=1 Tax=Anaerorhabdus sp. TaxID=1872524 RepID=UPI003A8B65D9